MSTKKRRYRVSATLTISVYTSVMATSEEEAETLASDRSIIGLCTQCAGGPDGEKWVTSGELDGEPMDITAELVKA